jgi:hypothetical protein
MRWHKHQVGRALFLHSVRVRHKAVWDWCAHQEEVERHLQESRRAEGALRARKGWRLQAAH